jgi:type I restriction enzyme, S subunit
VTDKMYSPYEDTKDSGIEFVGDIPEHWDTLRCGLFFKENTVKNKPGEPLLSVYRDYGVILRDSRDDNANMMPEDTSSYKLVEIDDFVFNKMKCWMGSLGVSRYRGVVSPSYRVYKITKKINGKYLHYLLRSQSYIEQYIKLSYGIRPGQWELKHEDFRNIVALFPTPSEQTQICKFLDDRVAKIDSEINSNMELIKLLKEKKQSLINDTVLGKINVMDIDLNEI